MIRLKKSLHTNKRYLFITVFFIVLLYVLLPQVSNFKSSWDLLSHPLPGWTLLAIVSTALTYFAAALTYSFLANHKLPFGRTVLVQLAAMFINKLLPGGLGAAGANFLYLKRNNHSAPQAATIVGVNNLLGFAGHAVLVLIMVILFTDSAAELTKNHSPSNMNLARNIILLAFILAAAVILWGRKLFIKAIKDSAAQLQSFYHRPGSIGLALFSSMILTIANVTALYCCAQALNVDLPIVAIFVIFTLGIGAGTATPTPGGLGGFEAGIVAGLVAYHVGSAPALAVALLYRLISYWLALIVGAIAFAIAQKRNYI